MRAAVFATGAVAFLGSWSAVEMTATEVAVVPGGPAVAAAFSRQPTRDRELATRFSWPALTAFGAVQSRSTSARVKSVDGAAATDGARSVDPIAWQDWTYVTTLMAMDGPLYMGSAEEEGPGQSDQALAMKTMDALKAGGEAGLTSVHAAIAQSPRLGAWEWDQVAILAAERGAVDLALAIRARYQPLGMCSLDDRPMVMARRYAELCYSAGKLACFLNLQVQIMGDQFERMAYSSYGEEAHGTEAEHLRDVGIDVSRFLRGLLYQFETEGVERRELGPWRLARSIREAGLDGQMERLLETELSRRNLDGWNRLRATKTIAYLRYQKGEPRPRGRWGPADDEARLHLLRTIHQDLSRFDLTPPARAWLERLATGEDG